MLGEYLLYDIRTEWFQVDPCGLSSEQRFAPVLKNLAHHRIDTSACDEVYVRLFVIFVPYFLNVADYAFVNVGESLKLINDERYLRVACIDHEFL